MIYVTIPNKGTKKFFMSPNLLVNSFIDYISKALKLESKEYKFYIEYEIGKKKRVKASYSSLSECGFCDEIKIVVEKNRKKLAGVTPLDIKEEYEEDEALRDALTSSMNDAFDIGRLADKNTNKQKKRSHYQEYDAIHMDDYAENKTIKEGYQEYDPINMDDYINEEIPSKENELALINSAVAEALNSKKIIMKLHSLKSLQRNLTQLYDQFNFLL